MKKILFLFTLLLTCVTANVLGQTFNYKWSGNPSQTRQTVHSVEKIMYVKPGQAITLLTPTNQYTYYRWYKINALGQETVLSGNFPTATGGPTRLQTLRGTVYFSNSSITLDGAYKPNYTVPTTFDGTGDETTIYCDMSNYRDYTYTSGTNSLFIEPTVSVRVVFKLRPASEMASAIDAAAGEALESYEIEAPAATGDMTSAYADGSRIRITSQYLAENYWVNVSGAPVQATQTNLYWYRGTETTPLTVSLGSDAGANDEFFYPKSGSQDHLQIKTNGKAGTTEIFTLKVRPGGDQSNEKAIAKFIINYKAKSAVGPKLITDFTTDSQEIFYNITRKKSIITRDFDQIGTAPNTVSTSSPITANLRLNPADIPLPTISGTFSYRGFGVQPLNLDESNYGFLSPLYLGRSGTAGEFRKDPMPFWSEYGFPQEINGASGSTRWSVTDKVNDITYKKTGALGNMLYIDAAQEPGKVASLKFSESFCEGARLYFSAYVINLNSSSSTKDWGTQTIRPNLTFILKVVDGNTETIVKRFTTGDIGFANHSNWYQVGFDFDVPTLGTGTTDIDFRLDIENNGLTTTGNDFAIDEIHVYRTNPAIAAYRTAELFCLPEGGEALTEPLFMNTEINLTQFWGTDRKDVLYYRFFAPQEGLNPGLAFPEKDGLIDNYPYSGHYAVTPYEYYYGMVDLDNFATNPDADGRYYKIGTPDIYYYYDARNNGDKILIIRQRIPASLLNTNEAGKYNLDGDFTIYVGESSDLTDPGCAGVGTFKIRFDATDFNIKIGSKVMSSQGEISACSNEPVHINAFAYKADDSRPGDSIKLFAFYDWYLGPQNTVPDAAKTANVTDEASFAGWALNAGSSWLASDEGEEWNYMKPNYVGYNSYGGFFGYDPSNGVANRISASSDFKTIKKDLRAFRFFYPYASNVNIADVTKYPVNSTEPIVKHIDYALGKYYDVNGVEINDAYPNVDNYRLDVNDYNASSKKDYLTNPNGQFIDASGNVLSDQTDPNVRVLYVNSVADLKNLVARIQYWKEAGLIKLYSNGLVVDVNSLAAQYLTAISMDEAFEIDDNDNPIYSDPQGVCATPAQIKLKASSVSPNVLFGEVNDEGNMTMPYNLIEDQTYVYTVRIAEKDASQFVAPLYNFSEAKNARVKLISVKNEQGVNLDIAATDSIINESYIGLINATDRNKLATDKSITYDQAYDLSTKASITGTQSVNLRWKLNVRNNTHALESYPLVYNDHNYYFTSNLPIFTNLQIGNPLAKNKVIGTNTVTQNKLGVEVMANDGKLSQFIQAGKFKPGYTYVFELEATGADTWTATTSDCDLNRKFQLKVVPDVIVWGATQNNGSEWNLDNNWFIAQTVGGEYAETASLVTTFPPLATTKVIIPEGYSNLSPIRPYSTLEKYENLTASLNMSDGSTIATGYDVSKEIIAFRLDPYVAGSSAKYVDNTSSVTTTKFIEFDYNYVPNSCDVIYFKHGGTIADTLSTTVVGGELARQDLLIYNSAKVDLKMSTSQWHSLAAPLRNMYSGDYSFPNINPLVDMRLFNTQSPQTGVPSVDWTQRFNTATVELEAGKPYSTYVGRVKLTDPVDAANLDLGYNTNGNREFLNNAVFTFPKTNTEFKFYNEYSKEYIYYAQYIETSGRAHSGRFIYETGDNNAIANPLLEIPIACGTVANSETGVMIIGNPFMAHLDYQKFYKENMQYIEREYKVLTNTRGAYNSERYATFTPICDGEGNFTDFSCTEGTGKGRLLPLIPPMQSFAVIVKSEYVNDATVKLKLTADMSKYCAENGGILRAPSAIVNPKLELETVSKDGAISKALVLLSDNMNNGFDSKEDTRLLTIGDAANTVVNVFTIADNKYLDVNRIRSIDDILPIGVNRGVAGTTKLRISGASSIPLSPGEMLVFVDTQEGIQTRIDMDDNFEYEFEYDGTEQTSRFFITRQIDTTTGIEDLTETSNTIKVFKSEKDYIHVVSVGDMLRNVELYDLKGTLVYKANDVNALQLKVPVMKNAETVYVLRATTDKKTESFKIVNK